MVPVEPYQQLSRQIKDYYSSRISGNYRRIATNAYFNFCEINMYNQIISLYFVFRSFNWFWEFLDYEESLERATNEEPDANL